MHLCMFACWLIIPETTVLWAGLFNRPGVDSGDTITIPKAGNSGGLGAISGNVYIRLKVLLTYQQS